jgi:hypothetical protein
MGADDDDDDTHAASELRDRRLRAALPLWAAAAWLKSAERVAWRWSLFIVMCMCVGVPNVGKMFLVGQEVLFCVTQEPMVLCCRSNMLQKRWKLA